MEQGKKRMNGSMNKHTEENNTKWKDDRTIDSEAGGKRSSKIDKKNTGLTYCTKTEHNVNHGPGAESNDIERKERAGINM